MAFRLPLYIQTGSSIPPIITEFTASGTWNKSVGCTRIIVAAFGGGGGGGGGGITDATLYARGGGHGGGGYLVIAAFGASDIPSSSYDVVIGAGGNGGLGRTSGLGDGSAGSIGGNTTFGSTLVRSLGGYGGTRGRRNNNTNNFVASGNKTNCIPSTTFQTTNSKIQVYSGGFDTGNTSTVASVNGLTQIYNETLSGNRAKLWGGGASGGQGGSYESGGGFDSQDGGIIQNQNLYAGCPILQTTLLGSGGDGGQRGNGSSNGGNGLNGGIAAGGGGGGGTSDGFVAGDGGNGGDGLCIIWEFYD